MRQSYKEFICKGKNTKTLQILVILFLICVCFTGCKKDNGNSDLETTPMLSGTKDTEIEGNVTPNGSETTKNGVVIKKVDYNECFDGIKGCAIFLNVDTEIYEMYNQELCEKQSSPCSTFKIISTLMGLESGVINSVASTMGYNGTIYPIDTWNKDLSLKDAFKESCVWYFRKVIDQIGQSEVQKWLDQLAYGNCDISKWNGSEVNSLPELNGFWLEASLEISPMEQVDVLAKIFAGKTNFSLKSIDIHKEVMLVQRNGSVSVYGKTGTGKNVDTGHSDNGWFVGMFENGDKKYCFAVRLNDEKSSDVNGTKAKEIALNIISKYYVE